MAYVRYLSDAALGQATIPNLHRQLGALSESPEQKHRRHMCEVLSSSAAVPGGAPQYKQRCKQVPHGTLLMSAHNIGAIRFENTQNERPCAVMYK